jgi:polyisoprenoid-binding protein YceI
MKKISYPLSIFLALLCTLALPAKASTEEYTFDPAHTYVLWHVNHFGFSDLSGKSMANGHIAFDEKIPQDSKVNVTITMADLVTGIPKLDTHLKSADFFNVTKFPVATFVSDKVEMTTPDTADIYGTLNLHNVSKSVVLKAKLNKSGIHPMSKKKSLGFTATTELKRSDFGVGLHSPDVSDTVKIEIQAEAYKTAAN